MIAQKHCDMVERCRDPNCSGMVKRDGWTYVDIDADTWRVPSWKCDKCGVSFWSYFDDDNGEEGYNTEEARYA